MVELIAKTPLDGFEPLQIAEMKLQEVDLGVITSLSPFRGQEDLLANAIKAAHDLDWPKPNRMLERGKVRVIWFGYEQAILTGTAADALLANHAALSDQSDAWAVAELSGKGARDVLARLTPIDLRPDMFEIGHSARTDLMHMPASITRLGDQSYLIMVFRSMAGTLWHDLQRAMESVAARA